MLMGEREILIKLSMNPLTKCWKLKITIKILQRSQQKLHQKTTLRNTILIQWIALTSLLEQRAGKWVAFGIITREIVRRLG